MTMKIGCCVNFLPKEADDPGTRYAKAIKDAGYDYIELPIGQITRLSEDDFVQMQKDVDKVGIPVYACNNFFVPELKLVGEKVEQAKIRAFYTRALNRAQLLGCKYVVFGSPWSKSCPDGFPYEQAFAQLIELCKELGDAAGERDITIALEPNNHTETNMLNTFSDVVTLAKAANHPNIRCLQDYFHLKVENDTVDSLLEYGNEFLVHSHFARLEGRGFPKVWTEDEYYPTYFKALKTIGYGGGVSMEGVPVSRDSFAEEAKTACAFLREATR